MGNQNKVGGFSTTCIATPVISTTAYTANDQLGTIMTLQGACHDKNSLSVLESIIVVDSASVNSNIVVFFFDSLPTIISNDNAPLNISDSEMIEKCLGAVSISNTSYQTTSSNSVATVLMPQCALAMRSLSQTGTLYVVAKIMSASTYTSTSDLTFKFSFSQDL